MNKNKQKLEKILSENNLKVFRKIQYDNILNFVFENIKSRSFPSRSYFFISILGFVLLLTYSILVFSSGEIQIKSYLIWFVGGIFAGSILIIPFHELLHA